MTGQIRSVTSQNSKSVVDALLPPGQLWLSTRRLYTHLKNRLKRINVQMSEIKYEGTALLDEDGEPVFGRQRNIRQATSQLLGVDIF